MKRYVRREVEVEAYQYRAVDECPPGIVNNGSFGTVQATGAGISEGEWYVIDGDHHMVLSDVEFNARYRDKMPKKVKVAKKTNAKEAK